MIWFLFALFSALVSAAQNLATRKVMLDADAWAYAFLENGISLLIFIPLALMAWSLPAAPQAWVLVAVAGLLWTVISVVIMFSYKYTKVSLRAPISESRTFWVLLFSALLLGEAVTAPKVLGIVIIFAGVLLVTYKPGASFGSFRDKGVQLTLLVTFLLAVVSILDKKALSYFSPNVYAVFVYLLPTAIIGAFVLSRRRKEVVHIVKFQPWLLAVVSVFGALSYFLQLQAYALADVSLVYPVLRLGTIFTVLGGIIFLGERENVIRKLAATVIVVLGVLLVSGNLAGNFLLL